MYQVKVKSSGLKETARLIIKNFDELSLPSLEKDLKLRADALQCLKSNGDTPMIFGINNFKYFEAISEEKIVEHQASLFVMAEMAIAFLKEAREVAKNYLRYGSDKYLCQELEKILKKSEVAMKEKMDEAVKEFEFQTYQHFELYRLFKSSMMGAEKLEKKARTVVSIERE